MMNSDTGPPEACPSSEEITDEVEHTYRRCACVIMTSPTAPNSRSPIHAAR
jgi:hypothetical protein